MHMPPPWLTPLVDPAFNVVTVLGCDSGLPRATAFVGLGSKRAVTERPSGERSTASASKNSRRTACGVHLDRRVGTASRAAVAEGR